MLRLPDWQMTLLYTRGFRVTGIVEPSNIYPSIDSKNEGTLHDLLEVDTAAAMNEIIKRHQSLRPRQGSIGHNKGTKATPAVQTHDKIGSWILSPAIENGEEYAGEESYRTTKSEV